MAVFANSFNEFLKTLRDHESETCTKYVCTRSPSSFFTDKDNQGPLDPRQMTGKRIHWNGAVPYLHFGTRTYSCHRGKDLNVRKKQTYAEQRNNLDLEKSLQFSTWKICSQIAESHNVKFAKEFVSTLGILALDQVRVLVEDLECFAKHSKRSTINGEDVKLLVRRIPTLLEQIELLCPKNKPKKKPGKVPDVTEDDLSNCEQIDLMCEENSKPPNKMGKSAASKS